MLPDMQKLLKLALVFGGGSPDSGRPNSAGLRRRNPLGAVLIALAAVVTATIAPASAYAEAGVRLAKTPVGRIVMSDYQSSETTTCGQGCIAAYQKATKPDGCSPFDCPPWAVLLVADDVPAGYAVRWDGCFVESPTRCWAEFWSDSPVNVRADFVDVDKPRIIRVASATQVAGGWVDVSADVEDNVGATLITVTTTDRNPPLSWSRTIPADQTGPGSRLTVSFDPRAELPSGSYAFQVTTADAAGNASEPASPPDVLIDSDEPKIKISDDSPAEDPGTRTNAPLFKFEVTGEPTGTVECGLLGRGGGACTGGQSSHQLPELGDGTYTLWVRASDRFGNVAVLHHRFRVDTTPPRTRIVGGPADGARTSERGARFDFEAEGRASYECALDGREFRDCISPHAVTALAPGEHSFRVRATDRALNVEPTPVSRTWTVVADSDGDSFDRGPDCDDSDAAAHPGAFDVADNGRDEDCDGADSINLDRDGDGYSRPQDCDDNVSAINPGAPDISGDRRDQDCDGADALWPRLRTQVRMPVKWKDDSRSQVVSLVLTDLPRGTVVTITCKSPRKRSCPFARKRLTAPRDGTWLIKRPFQNRWLPAGTRIEVTVQRRDAIGPAVTYVTRAKTIPKRSERCFVPGTKQPTVC
jgi:hypothetical protein